MHQRETSCTKSWWWIKILAVPTSDDDRIEYHQLYEGGDRCACQVLCKPCVARSRFAFGTKNNLSRSIVCVPMDKYEILAHARTRHGHADQVKPRSFFVRSFVLTDQSSEQRTKSVCDRKPDAHVPMQKKNCGAGYTIFWKGRSPSLYTYWCTSIEKNCNLIFLWISKFLTINIYTMP